MVGTLYRYSCRNGKAFISKEGSKCRKIISKRHKSPNESLVVSNHSGFCVQNFEKQH